MCVVWREAAEVQARRARSVERRGGGVVVINKSAVRRQESCVFSVRESEDQQTVHCGDGKERHGGV